MMCNEVNNVHVIFTNSEPYTHNANPFPIQASPRHEHAEDPKKVLQGICHTHHDFLEDGHVWLGSQVVKLLEGRQTYLGVVAGPHTS